MKAIIVVLLLAGVGYYAFLEMSPHDEIWLHGEWKYHGAEADTMTFKKDGSVEMRNADRIYAICVYSAVIDDEVGIECELREQVHELRFAVSNEGRTLTNMERSDSVFHKVGS